MHRILYTYVQVCFAFKVSHFKNIVLREMRLSFHASEFTHCIHAYLQSESTGILKLPHNACALEHSKQYGLTMKNLNIEHLCNRMKGLFHTHSSIFKFFIKTATCYYTFCVTFQIIMKTRTIEAYVCHPIPISIPIGVYDFKSDEILINSNHPSIQPIIGHLSIGISCIKV